jgi:hypothetical protein
MYGCIHACMFCSFEECFELVRICVHGVVIIRKCSVMVVSYLLLVKVKEMF